MNVRATIVSCSVLLTVAACASHHAAPSAGVPSLNVSSSPTASGTARSGNTGAGASLGAGAARVAAVHAAAECIRQHGVPTYPDPIVTADGQVFSDLRTVQDAPRSVGDTITTACATLLTQAGFSPSDEPPAPPALVQAGVKAAQCLRAHGLAAYRDPTAQTPYTPGHGFAVTQDEAPAGGKADPSFQGATQACRSLLDAEITASTLANLTR